MLFHLLNRDWSKLLRHQARKSLLNAHTQGADTFLAQPKSRS